MDYSSGFDSYGSSYGSSNDVGGAIGGVAAGLGVLFSALGIGAIILAIVVSIGLIVFGLWLHGRYYKKMGYSPWLALLRIIPIIELFMFIYFAFVEWPIEKQLKDVAAEPKKVESKQ